MDKVIMRLMPIQNQSGFTLLEMIISITVLALGILTLALMQITSIKGNEFGRDMTLANTLAQGRVEQIVNESDFANIDEVNFPDEASVNGFDKFSRDVEIETIGNNKQITVTVAWERSGGGLHKVTLSTLKSRF